MKKIKLFVWTVVFCLMSGLCANAMTIVYDGAEHEYNTRMFSLIVNNRVLTDLPMPPIIFNDRALVPVREIFEELGAEVKYNMQTREVRVEYGDTKVLLRINDNVAEVNGVREPILDNVVPKLIGMKDGELKTMVPVRFISESIKIPVDFDSDNAAILVNSRDYSFEEAAKEKYINDVSYEVVGTNTVEVRVETSARAADYSSFSMTDPNRVVTDLEGFKLGNVSNMQINKGGVEAIRFGDNGSRSRIVIDIDGEIKDFSTEIVADNEMLITVETKKNVSVPTATPKPTPTQKPTSTPAPTATPKPTATATPKYTAAPSSAKLIILDPGHGGTDSGAVGKLDGKAIYEKDLTLSIAKQVRDILKNRGYNVELTRENDVLLSLSEPPKQANERNAALFVSIHINSAEATEAYGTEVYYSLENNGDTYGTTSEVLAKRVLNEMLYNMESKNRGVKTANHAVTRRCNMPAVLAEVGFISNEDELRKMCSSSYQQKVAVGIADGIILTMKDIEMPN